MAQGIQQYPRSTVSDVRPIIPYRGHGKETQLRFNLEIATHPANLASQFSNPSPIIIEKILTSQNKPSENLASEDMLRNSCSSVSFSVVSEERLNLALQLAKRDLKLKHLGKKSEVKSAASHPHQGSPKIKPGIVLKNHKKPKAKTQTKKSGTDQAIKYEVTESGAKVYVYTPDRNRINVGVSDSPPTHDPGPGESPKKVVEPSEQEIKRLQKELHTYMQKIEELAKKEHCGEVLEPSEEARGRIRQQQRMARSTRMLYVLQQQVKEIQEDLEKLSPQKIKHTKKTRTMSRLAAVHRGAIRALQMFITQLSERGEQQIPSLYKELGQLIRQLSLCTAKLDSGRDSTSSDIIISILQQVEDLDTLLQEKIYSQTKKTSPNVLACRSSPSRKESSNAGHYTQPVYKETEPKREDWMNVNRRLVLENPPELLSLPSRKEPELVQQPSTPERQAALRSGLEALIQTGHLNGVPKKGVRQSRHKGVLLPQRPMGFRQPRKTDPARAAHFQKKTVAFKLKENQPIVREKKTPWVPPNPTSPPASPKRDNWARGSKLSGVSPSRNLDLSYSLKAKQTEKEESVTEEALRLDWLDSETAKRMKQLDDLYREEIAHLRKLREEADLLKRLPDPQKASDSGPRQQAQTKKSVLSGNGRDSREELTQLPGNEYSHIFQQDDSNLEAMIQRMEEIEKHQEAVRQRFTRIVYSDPEFWAEEERERTQAPTAQRPQSPHPIRITKPTGQIEPEVHIYLEEPFEGDYLQIKKEELARTSPVHFIQQSASSTKDHLHLSVPVQMLQSIYNYSESYNRHLRLTSHEEVGDFNPWHISERLAEELIDGALGEVAEELQDLCEGYAEAVFTSEFMEPTANNY